MSSQALSRSLAWPCLCCIASVGGGEKAHKLGPCRAFLSARAWSYSPIALLHAAQCWQGWRAFLRGDAGAPSPQLDALRQATQAQLEAAVDAYSEELAALQVCSRVLCLL